MDADISTTGLRVTGVPIGNDEWVQQFVQAKAAAVKVDVGHSSAFPSFFASLSCQSVRTKTNQNENFSKRRKSINCKLFFFSPVKY